MTNVITEQRSWQQKPTHNLDPSKVLERQAQLAADLPRSNPSQQYMTDKEHERAFVQMVTGNIPHATLIGHYLIHERQNRLRRIKAYEQRQCNDSSDATEVVEPRLAPLLESEDGFSARLTQLQGTWECQEVDSEDVSKETIYVDAVGNRSLFGRYQRDGFFFAIQLCPSSTRLVPGGTLSRRRRHEAQYMLEHVSPTELIWKNVDFVFFASSVRVTRVVATNIS